MKSKSHNNKLTDVSIFIFFLILFVLCVWLFLIAMEARGGYQLLGLELQKVVSYQMGI